MSEFTIAHELHNMVPGPAPSAVVQVIYKTEKGIMLCYGTTADTVLEAEAADTYAPGCIYIKSVVAGTSLIYYNVGAAGAVASFTAMS
jgi:hypothetical protein